MRTKYGLGAICTFKKDFLGGQPYFIGMSWDVGVASFAMRTEPRSARFFATAWVGEFASSARIRASGGLCDMPASSANRIAALRSRVE
jgi:hypothetical protein